MLDNSLGQQYFSYASDSTEDRPMQPHQTHTGPTAIPSSLQGAIGAAVAAGIVVVCSLGGLGATFAQSGPDRPGFVKASAAIGTTVRDAAGNEAGRIEDIVFDASTGRVAFAIVSFGGVLGFDDRLFAVPWEAMSYASDRNAYVLQVRKETLQQVSSFDRKAWPDLGDLRWAEGIRKYWSDATITASIKARLAAERSATLTQIDIDTTKGVVAFQGTVESEAMKQRAAEIARQVDGVRNVVNNLKVQPRG